MKDLVKSKYYKPVACGVLTAIVTVATMFLSIPIPVPYQVSRVRT